MGLPECMSIWTSCSWRKLDAYWIQCSFKVSLKLWLNSYSGWRLTENHVKIFLGRISGSDASLLYGRISMSRTSNATLPHGVQIQLSFHLGCSCSVLFSAYMILQSLDGQMELVLCFSLGLLREILPFCSSLVQQNFIPRPYSSFTLSPSSFFLMVLLQPTPF